MPDQKLTQLTAATVATVDDLLYIVDDPGGTPLSRKITVANFLSSLVINTGGGTSTSTAGLAGTGFYYIVGSSTPLLPNSKIITAGSSVTIATDSTSMYISATTGATGAPTSALYVVMSANATLSNEFIFTAGSNITFSTAGGLLTVNAITGGIGSGNVLAGTLSDRAIVVGSGGAQNIATTQVTIDTNNGILGVTALSVSGLVSIKRSGLALDVTNTSGSVSTQIANFHGGNQTAPAVDDEGYISLSLFNAQTSQVEYGRLVIISKNLLPGGPYGEIVFAPKNNGTIENRIGIASDFIAPTSTYSNSVDFGTSNRFIRNIYVSTSSAINVNNGQYNLSFGSGVMSLSSVRFQCPGVQVNNNGYFRSSQNNGEGYSLQVFDGDDGIYRNWASILNANVPNVNLTEQWVTMNNNYIYRMAGTDVLVADGGTGSSTASGARLNLGLSDGTYTPTLTLVANLDTATSYVCNFLMVGSTVTVSGRADIDPTAPAATTQLGISLPIATLFNLSNQCCGTAFAQGVAGQGAAIVGDPTNEIAKMQYVSGDVTNQAMYFTFTYRIG